MRKGRWQLRFLHETRGASEPPPSHDAGELLKQVEWGSQGRFCATTSDHRLVHLRVPAGLRLGVRETQLLREEDELRCAGALYDVQAFAGGYALLCEKGVPVRMVGPCGRAEASYVARDPREQRLEAHCARATGDSSLILVGTRRGLLAFDALRGGTCSSPWTSERRLVSRVATTSARWAAACFYDSPDLLVLHDGQVACRVPGVHASGTSHVAFSPDGLVVYSGGRRGCSHIVAHDLRMAMGAQGDSNPVMRFARATTTNQPMRFSLASGGARLLTGDGADSLLRSYDTATGECRVVAECVAPIHSVAAHPTLAFALTASGSRSFESSLGPPPRLSVWEGIYC